MDELFDVFDGKQPPSTAQPAQVNGTNGTSPKKEDRKGKKRDGLDNGTAEAPAPKRVKQDDSLQTAEEPVRADEFEEEASRQVAASKGLAGSAGEGEHVVLSHQVRKVALSKVQKVSARLFARFDIKLLCLLLQSMNTSR